MLADLLKKSPEEIKAVKDPCLELAAALFPAYQQIKEAQKARKGALDTLFARLSDAKEMFLGKAFIPDANGTLRLTFGRIKGYEPADAVSLQTVHDAGRRPGKNDRRRAVQYAL